MSLRQAIRSRFKSSDRGDKDNDSPTPSKKKEDDKSENSDRPRSLSEQHKDKDSASASPAASPSTPRAPDIVCETDEETFALNRSMYELQLNQLQEQLVAAMIENQGLADELNDYKKEDKLKNLERNLELEKHKVDYLAKKLDEVQTKHGVDVEEEWIDVACEAQEDDHHAALSNPAPHKPKPKGTWRERVNEWFFNVFYEYAQDFSGEPVAEDLVKRDEDQLTVKKLKENIKRFKAGSKPIYLTIKGIRGVLHWKYPAFTLLTFIVYMYSVVHGWLLPVFLFLLIFRLFINYLRHKGWNVNITYFADYEEEDKSKDSNSFGELGMSDKFNLVLQVARKVQNTLGEIADSLEKLKNLLTWKQPESTLRLFLALCAAFIASVVLPGETLFFLGALYMGVKYFLIEYIYYRFPRIKARHDTVHKIWKSLPTDVELEKRSHKQSIRRNVLPSTVEALANLSPGDHGASLRSSGSAGRISDDDTAFCQLFDLPLTEMPLPGWEGGRRCTLVNKDKPLTSAFKHGKLYLTNSFLCFERYKSPSPKNLMLPLSDITNVVKAKPYSWMPGGGMSIEVSMATLERPYIFGAILSRDEAFTNIYSHGKKLDLEWAKHKPTEISEKGDHKRDSEDSLSIASQSSSSPRASPARRRKSEVLVDEEGDK